MSLSVSIIIHQISQLRQLNTKALLHKLGDQDQKQGHGLFSKKSDSGSS